MCALRDRAFADRSQSGYDLSDQEHRLVMLICPPNQLIPGDMTVTWPADPNLPSQQDAQCSISLNYSLQVPFLLVTAILQARLERAGLQIVTATNASERWHMFRSTTPQLVTLDIVMPSVDGLDAFSLLTRIHIEAPNTAVFIVSGSKSVRRSKEVHASRRNGVYPEALHRLREASRPTGQTLCGLCMERHGPACARHLV